MTTNQSPTGTESILKAWKHRIARELEEGEKILWTDQPDPTMAMIRHLPVIGGVSFVLVVLFVGVAAIGWQDVFEGRAGTLIPSALLLLSLVAMACLLLWHRRLARATCYALTSRRALTFVPSFFGKLQLTSYFPEQLRHARFERSRIFGAEAGDWVFRQQVTKHVKRHYSEGMPAPTRVEESFSVTSYGFLNLRDALKIEPLLRRVARGE